MSYKYGSSIWAKLALAAVVIAMILDIVGFATNSWMVYQTTTNSIRVGLWTMKSCVGSACTESSVPDSFKTDNFVAAQAFQVIALILFVGLPFIVGAYVVISAARVRCMAIFAIVVCFTAAFVILVGMIIWMVYVTSPYVISWSMGLTVLAGILAGIAGCLLVPDVLDDDYYDDRPPTYRSRNPTPKNTRFHRR